MESDKMPIKSIIISYQIVAGRTWNINITHGFCSIDFHRTNLCFSLCFCFDVANCLSSFDANESHCTSSHAKYTCTKLECLKVFTDV